MLQIMFSGLFSSFLASLGFGILFNIKGKNLDSCWNWWSYWWNGL